MQKISPNTPVIVGVSQFTQRWEESKIPLEPLALAQKVCEEAIQDTQKPEIQHLIDGVFVVNIFGYGYEYAPAELAQRLDIKPQKLFYSALGGNTPQYLVNKICLALEKGELNAVLLTGGEANNGFSKALKSGLKLDWTPKKNPKQVDDENKMGSTDLENNYDLYLPTNVYPILETALRAKANRNIAEHQQFMGRLYEKLALASSKNPHAWTQNAFTAEQIYQPTEDNRYISFPYTKRMCANNNVDQAAAILLTTVGQAEKLGISPEKWVFPMGGADLNDVWDFASRKDLTESIAIREASKIALKQANLNLDEITAFDLYSCFPSAVQIGMQAIGIDENDERQVSLTGGLSFFGGPWNNYTMHSIASAIERIRQKPDEKILISALGWFVTKHSIGIYGKNPPAELWQSKDLENTQEQINQSALTEPVTRADGTLKILGYTIFHDKNGNPNKGVVLGELETGERTFAWIDADTNELADFEKIELVGKTGKVQFNADRKRNFVKLNI